MHIDKQNHDTLVHRGLAGALLFLVLLLIGVQIAKAGEIIPAVGMTRPIDGDQAKMFGSLALRGDLAPIIKTEIGVAYRSESRFDDRLTLRTWPVTASLWLVPIPGLYAGAGVGWYHTTYDYAQNRILLPISDQTKEEFGVHVGGGLLVPLGPSAGLDLGGRYVMMRQQDSHLIPDKFDPDFWSSTLGLAFKF